MEKNSSMIFLSNFSFFYTTNLLTLINFAFIVDIKAHLKIKIKRKLKIIFLDFYLFFLEKFFFFSISINESFNILWL